MISASEYPPLSPTIMIVSELIDHLREVKTNGPLTAEISRIVCDSRQAGPDTLFCALRGTKYDGTRFIDDAIAAGCRAILCDLKPSDAGVAWITAANPRRAMAEAAAALAVWPSADLRVAGVTGTNGKTTIAFLTRYLMEASKGRAGMIGTVTVHDGLAATPATHTTPESIELQQLLCQMRDNGCYGVAMEVSSHALAQYRTDQIHFDAAVFTNLTQDHLDYHQTMEAYFAAKVRLFEQVANYNGPKKPVAIVNIDDPYGRRIVQRLEGTGVKVVRYGVGVMADLRASEIRFDLHGTTCQLEASGRQFLLRLPLIGRFNVYNALAALGAAQACGLNLREAIHNLANAPQVPGRMESVGDTKAFRVFVDYAHTPDALENALRTVKELRPRRLIVVFGCGGDRDETKRPKMGAIADELADFTVLTSDNPRSENPEDIIADIRRGIGSERLAVQVDRADAIYAAIDAARPGDIVLIAGKGHETTQTFADRVEPFDDRLVARQAMTERLQYQASVGFAGRDPRPPKNYDR
jgi:UDP-N-acetylmuramoyl-L-alanyl-D-glutamate--2,6-diaminopimelate ligase